MDKEVQIALLQKALMRTARELDSSIEGAIYGDVVLFAQQVVDLAKWLADLSVPF